MDDKLLIIITDKNLSKKNNGPVELKEIINNLNTNSNENSIAFDQIDEPLKQKLSKKVKVKIFNSIDEFEKNIKSIICETGLILYDISVNTPKGRRGILENLNEIIKDCLSEKSLINYPPIGFIAEKYRIKILEEQVISPDYPKFIGIFSYKGLHDPSFISLTDNFLNLSGVDIKSKIIGETCKTEIEKVHELTTFFNTRKFSSLFIGKNRQELLRLRTELINMKDVLISWIKSDLVKEFQNNSEFLRVFFNNLSNSKKSDEVDEDLNKYFKKNDESSWKGFSVLILGDTGTGKTLVSEWINSFVENLVSNNGKKCIIETNQFNCANLTEELFDSGFFGILDKMATEVKDRFGKILESIGKIMFLDEVAELLPQCQSKLLTYLQEFKMRPEGFDKSDLYIPNFLVAATNRDIQPESEKEFGRSNIDSLNEVKDQKFRQDLYHRFKFVIKLLPLKERKEDLEILIDYVLQDPNVNALKSSKNEAPVEYLITNIENRAVDCLKEYDYPGNFRELERILKDAVNRAIFYNSNILLFDHLPEYIKKYKKSN